MMARRRYMVLETPAVTQFARAMAPALSRTMQAFYLAGQSTFVAFSTRKQPLIRLCSLRIPDASEVQRAVNQMASGKAPGQDGLPPELPELLNERDQSEYLFPRNVIILLVLIVELAAVTNGTFFSILYLGEDGSYRSVGGIAIQNKLAFVIWKCENIGAYKGGL